MILTVDSIGDPAGIVSGTTKITRDPVSLVIARLAADLIEASGLIKNDLRFQTGAGGISLAAAKFVREKMRAKGVIGDYLLGGTTGYLVDMLEEGLFKRMFDVQCFDLKAVESLRKNVNHMEITASQYASPDVADSYASRLDTVLLGATEIDTDFNVNVHTDSNGLIIGGSGGHSDTAAGAKLTVIVAPLVRARLPIVVDKVLTVSTPGNTVDALVTEHGIAVNPANTELTERLADSGLPLTTIGELRQKALSMTGIPKRVPMTDTVVGRVLYRDGSEIDAIHTPEA
jgi:citrate lyase subunit alpha/citrate CoA-transferase